MNENLPQKLTAPYDPKETEPRIYKLWEESGYFNPDNLPERHKEPFTVIMPPPNANGSLHAGHAVFVTVEDLMIRYKRMNGYRALWVPGADHAGFETQVVYEKKLEKEGRSRFQMERDDLYREIMDFTLGNKSFMEGQIRQLGASCDWSREKFTLDPSVIKTVYQTFQKLSDDGLLYRGKRIINWCAKHQTSLSDIETEFKEKEDPFYYFKYGPFTIGTARPETKFGDKYVVMHPKDERYKEYVDGQKIDLEWINGPITATVIKDEAIDMEFGTGVMTITPWHDAIDFGIAERHGLEREQIIDLRGKLLPIAGEFAGMKTNEARTKIVEKLKEKGLLEKVEEKYKHNVKVCYKCEQSIEPQIQDQWFVKIKPLAEKALEAVRTGKVSFVTEKYEKIFYNWMENIQDWNISRQIVWGIPIPAKLCDACNEGFVDIEDTLTACPKCKGAVKKDIDTFDTWFSSGQWPFAVLGGTETDDFKTYYPTDVMETAADIIFFWVARMIMFGIYRTGNPPFHTIYLHGLVRDKNGLKMSKSKGNVTSPLEMTEKYGTDAFRMALVVGNTPGSDMNLSEDKIKGYKHFANKIWNVARFVLSSIEGLDTEQIPELSDEDQAVLAELEATIKDVTEDIEKYRFYMAGEKLYHYFWHTFADVILEASKPRIFGDDEKSKKSAQWMLLKILETNLKALHPFMPFVTEEVWEILPTKNKKLLIIETWPYTTIST
jgi:valyl-tRNA synthetase